MDKEVVVHIHNGIFNSIQFSCSVVSNLMNCSTPGLPYSAIKRKNVRSVLMRWMNIELIIQSEVSQNEKDKYRVLMDIYGI